MKRRAIWTATAILVCLAVFLYACGREDDSATTEPPAPWSEAEIFTLPSETQPQTQKESDEATDTDAILRRIETARAVYGLFSESRPQLDKTDSIEIEEGLIAYRVSDPQLDTIEKLQAYVSGYFSEDITQWLFSVGIYTESEGKLYALDVGMPSAKTDQPVVEVTEKTDSSESYCLTVRSDTDDDGVPDTEKTCNFVYAKQKNGQWVFTRFESY